MTTLKLGMQPLKQALQVNNINGTNNSAGQITRFCNLWICHGKTVTKQGFYIANLGHDQIILGHLWFATFNPDIDWKCNQLKGEDVTIDTATFHNKAELGNCNLAFHITIPQPDEAKKERSNVYKQLSEKYHHHWQVFSDWASQHYLPAQDEDHIITLKPGAPATMDCKIYHQTEKELEATQVFIDKHLAKGYIKESNSPYTSPIFYRAKKDSTLYPIMDYQLLNSWTVHDTYPLPLINDIINHLQGKTLFTKFDIRWGYNNIRIHEEDQWMAAFKTPFGLFQPTVMYFGLTNSLATFIQILGWIFRHLKTKYWLYFWEYVDDLLIAMGPGEDELHEQIVHEVLDILEMESFFLCPSKCVFEQTHVKYLDIVVDGEKLTIDPKKVDGLCKWLCTLKTVKEVCSVLGILV